MAREGVRIPAGGVQEFSVPLPNGPRTIATVTYTGRRARPEVSAEGWVFVRLRRTPWAWAWGWISGRITQRYEGIRA